jgi:hypothetical protein
MDEDEQTNTEQTPTGYTVPVPKRDELFDNLKKAAKPDERKKSPPSAAGS